MSENNNNDKVFLCKYVVGALVISLGDQKLELDPSNILNIDYLNDYDHNLRAILRVTLRIDAQRKIWLLQNKRSVTAKFELNKVGMDIDVETYVTALEPVWNCVFKVYFNDDDESIDLSALEKRVSLNDGSNDIFENENYFESQNTLDVYLFNQDLLDASNKIVNAVLTSDTLQQFAGYVLTKSKHPAVLMSKFENTRIYKELLVPALPSYKALIYLDQYYGFYKLGSVIYYDLDVLYILNANGKLTASRNNEWAETVLMVFSIDNSTPGNGMIRREGESKYYISLNDMNINPQKPSLSGNETVGSKAKLIVTDDLAVDVSTADQDFMEQRNTYIGYIKKDDNRYSADMIRARMEENECIIYVDANNLDISAFTPNKEYSFVFTETSKHEKYGKNRYRLVYAQHMIRRESTQYMTSSHKLVFKKCPN